MRSGFAPQTAGVPVGTVTVDGVQRDATSVSTVREIGGTGVPGLSSTAAAEGSVEFGQPANSTSGPAASPWTRSGNFPPAPGSSVQVDMGTQVESFRALTGVVDSSSAGSDGIVSASVMDPVDKLHRKVTILPLLASLPPLEMGGAVRNVGLSSAYIVDKILRHCNIYTTPTLPASSAGVYVPGQGSMLPERGTVTTSGNFAGTSSASFLQSEWGWGMYTALATYTPDGTLPMNGTELSCMVSQYHASGASVRVSPVGSAATIDLAINADRSIDARYTYAGSTVISCSLPAVEKSYTRVSMRVSAGSMTLMTDDGRTVNGTNPAPSSVMSVNASEVIIRASEGARIGGVTVGNVPFRHFLDQQLTGRLYAGTGLAPQLVASEAILRRDSLDVIAEIAKATCCSYWWDEDGFFHWMPGDYMMVRAPALTITSMDNLVDLGWSESLADTYRDVAVDYDTPIVNRSRYPDIKVWQGSGDSMGSFETREEWVGPSGNEEWIQPDAAPIRAQGSFLADLNLGRRSMMGGIRTDGLQTSWAYLAGGTEYLHTDIEYISPLTWKFTHTTVGLPTGESIQLVMPDEDAATGFWQRWRNEKLPIVRAYGKVEWANASASSGSGLSGAGTYQHDGGRWVQGYSGESAARIAAFLADWLCKPRVMATGVEVVHDPRIQVGDIVTVRDEHAHGVELKVLVTRVQQEVSAGESSMSLDFFVIDGSPAWRTLGEHDAAGTGRLTDHNIQESGENMGEHNADPWHRV